MVDVETGWLARGEGGAPAVLWPTLKLLSKMGLQGVVVGSKGIIKVAYILAEASWYWGGGFLSSEHRKVDQIGISGKGVSGVELGRVFGGNRRRRGEGETRTFLEQAWENSNSGKRRERRYMRTRNGDFFLNQSVPARGSNWINNFWKAYKISWEVSTFW